MAPRGSGRCGGLEIMRKRNTVKCKYLKKLCLLLVMAILVWAGMDACTMLFSASNNIIQNWQSFYRQERNSIDCLFVGNSHAFSTFDPDAFDRAWGEKTYILASNSQTVSQAYYNVKEALKYQSPRMIVLEAFSFDNNSNWQDDSVPSDAFDRDWKKDANIDGMRMGLVKLEAIRAQYTVKNWPYALFGIIRYHQNWAHPHDILKCLRFLLFEAKAFNGFQPSVTTMGPKVMKEYEDMEERDAPFAISDVNVRAFHALVDLCEKEGVRLVVVMAPMYDKYVEKIHYENQYAAVSSLVEGDGIEYVDCNMLYDEIGLTASDFEDGFSTIVHLNAQGARKVSLYLAERIVP